MAVHIHITQARVPGGAPSAGLSLLVTIPNAVFPAASSPCQSRNFHAAKWLSALNPPPHQTRNSALFQCRQPSKPFSSSEVSSKCPRSVHANPLPAARSRTRPRIALCFFGSDLSMLSSQLPAVFPAVTRCHDDVDAAPTEHAASIESPSASSIR